MSKRFWGLDWGALLPWRIDDDTRIEWGTFDDAESFIRATFPSTFNVEKRWLVEPMSEAKRRFAAEMDVFLCRHRDEIVGVLAGHPSDWSTYYWRTVAMRPDFRGAGLLNALGDRIVPRMREVGIARMEADASAGNLVMMHFLQKIGFIVTGNVSSERWGLAVRLTHFLDPSMARIYRDNLLDVPNFASTRERSRS